MVKTRLMDDITLHPHTWRPIELTPKHLNVVGLDTETEKGYAKLLTVSTPRENIICRLRSFQDFINVAHEINAADSVNFFYNVDFDFSALAKWMGERRLNDLAKVGVTRYNHHEVTWIPSKGFSIYADNGNRRGKLFRFFDLAQFYDKKPLKTVARIVGREKKEFDVRQIDFARYDSIPKYAKELNQYALEDAMICQLAAQRLYDAVNQVVPVQLYYSTASIAQAFFLSHIPDDLRLPPGQVMEAALQAYGGGRFELVKRGYAPRVWEADINSAYPFEMDKLVGIRKSGTWKNVRNMNPEAHYGFYLVSVKTSDTYLSPLMVHQEGSIIYPHGQIQKWMERSELDLVVKMGFAPKILQGWEYHDPYPSYPFRFISQTLYPERLRHKKLGNDDLQYVYKITMNSGYGKTIQLIPSFKFFDELPVGFNDTEKIVKEIVDEDDRVSFALREGWNAGRMFNPVYACAITARTRSRLLSSVLSYRLERSLFGFATDCMFSKSPFPDSMIGGGLGEWKLEIDSSRKAHPGLFIGSGVYAIRDAKELVDPITKTRKRIDLNHYRGFVTKHNLFDYIVNGFIVTREGGEERRGIRFDMESPVKLKEGVRGGIRTTPTGEEKISWRDIAVFKPLRKMLDLNFDRKRRWDRNVRVPKDLLENEIDSSPLVV